jgi:hypothetical protein
MTVSNAIPTCVTPSSRSSEWSERRMPRVAPTSTPLWIALGAPK